MEIGRILTWINLNWFTVLYSWTKLRRYVVAFTNNTQRNVIHLWAQILEAKRVSTNITLGGRTDPQGNVFVDVGTSTDSLMYARLLQGVYKQQAIWDTLKQEEIF